MNIVIMGCGRLGARLASTLTAQDHSVTIVDRESSAFERLPKDFSGNTVIGTGIDEDVLRVAGIDTADVFIAVTGADNRNIMGAQVAQTIFQVPVVVARIYDPVRADTYREMGLRTICPTTTMTALIMDQISEALTDSRGK